MSPLVQLEQVTKTYNGRRAAGTAAAADITMAIEKGEAVAMMGPSDSG